MLVICIFSFSHKYFLYHHCKSRWLNPFPNKPCFLRVCSTSLMKTLWEKEKLLVTSNFSISHSVFYLFGEVFAIFIKFEIVVCKLFHFGTVKKLLFGKGFNPLPLQVVCPTSIYWEHIVFALSVSDF